jgi:hypothetical protein
MNGEIISKLIIGKTYQSLTHGKVRYVDEDEFMGETSYKFLAFQLPERPYLYWKFKAINNHLTLDEVNK